MKAPLLRERSRSSWSFALLALAALLMPEMALAQSAPWATQAENTYNLIMDVVRYIALIGVVGCGLAALFGKLSWDWAGKIVIGLLLIFAAPTVVDYFRTGIGG